MCGITGIIYRKKNPIYDKAIIEKMLKRIIHRGPDDTGICGFSLDNKLYSVENVLDIKKDVWGLLGFNRLSIQDVTSAGHQPMLSPNRDTVITFNGEIYNVQELRHELGRTGKYQFKGNSDTEVILYLYLEYGFMKMIQKLNGMFAIVLYDTKLNTIYFARDRFGIIPLHIYITDSQIVYGSEIKAILECSGFTREICLNSVFACLTYGYPNDPLHEKIKNIQPGTVLIWNGVNDEIQTVQYFDIDAYRQSEYSSKYDYVEEANEVLKTCVHRQLISDVNLGIQLSGGVDSTLLARYVSDYFKEDNRLLYGFSMTNHDATQYDEEKYIDYAASLNDIRLKKTDLCFDRFIECLEKSIYAFERPFYSLPPVGIYLFSKEAKKKVTVLISGEGADEVGGGYSEMFGKYKSYESYFTNSRSKNMPLEYDSVNGSREFIEYFDKIRGIKSYTDLEFDANLDSFINERKTFWDGLHGTAFDKLRKMHFKYRLVSMLERQNKVCMANSVENRVPFLDNEFVDYMFTLPEEVLMHKCELSSLPASQDNLPFYEGKYLLKRMNAVIYGDDFAFRKKQAIHAPLCLYLSHPRMIDYINEVIIPSMSKRGMINMKSFRYRLKNISENENTVAVWKYINMELWFQYFVDGRTEYYHGY